MDRRTKTLLNLQSLEFPEDGKVRGRRKPQGFEQTIRKLRARLSVQVLREYDSRKRRYGPQSVVPILGEVCSGCQVTLSLNTRRHASRRLVECEHCGRLLYNRARRRRLRIEFPFDAAA